MLARAFCHTRTYIVAVRSKDVITHLLFVILNILMQTCQFISLGLPMALVLLLQIAKQLTGLSMPET